MPAPRASSSAAAAHDRRAAREVDPSARGVLEPGAPERSGVAEHAVQVDRERPSSAPAAPQQRDADRDAGRVDRHVERRPVSPRDEVLVKLVARRVGDARGNAGAARQRPDEEDAEHRVLGQCASLRRTRSQVPSPVPRWGIDERAKISAAQSEDGQPAARARIGHRPMIGSPETRSTVREPGASPGRSRRCEGRCSPPRRHWPWAGKAAEGEPRVRRPAARRNRTPRGRRIRGSERSHSSVAAGVVAAARPRSRARQSGSRASATLFGATEPRRGGDAARRARRGERPASSTPTSPLDLLRLLRRPGRYASPEAARRGWVFKVNDVSPPGRCRRPRAEATATRPLVLRDLRRLRRPADARSSGGRATATSSRCSRRRRQKARAATRCLHGGRARRSRRRPAAACIGAHRGLVRATAPGVSARTPSNDPARALAIVVLVGLRRLRRCGRRGRGGPGDRSG